MSTALVVGGTGGLGRPIAARLAERGADLAVTSRDAARATSLAAELGPAVRGLALDLTRPDTIEAALVDVGAVDQLVITAIEQHALSLRDFDLVEATRAVTTKLVGYTEVVRALADRFTPTASVVLFGGLAKERPYPGSTMVTAFNGGVSGLVKTLAIEIAPVRVNAVHPGIVGDSPKWTGVDHPHRNRTPLGRLVTTEEIVHATEFLLDNTGINAQDLYIEGGVLVT